MSFLETLQLVFTILGPLVGFIGITMVGAKLEKRSEPLLQDLPEETWKFIEPLRRHHLSITLVSILVGLPLVAWNSGGEAPDWTAWVLVGFVGFAACYEIVRVFRIIKVRKGLDGDGSDSVSRGLFFLGFGRGLTATALLVLGIVYAYVVAWKGIEGKGGAF